MINDLSLKVVHLKSIGDLISTQEYSFSEIRRKQRLQIKPRVHTIIKQRILWCETVANGDARELQLGSHKS